MANRRLTLESIGSMEHPVVAIYQRDVIQGNIHIGNLSILDSEWRMTLNKNDTLSLREMQFVLKMMGMDGLHGRSPISVSMLGTMIGVSSLGVGESKGVGCLNGENVNSLSFNSVYGTPIKNSKDEIIEELKSTIVKAEKYIEDMNRYE